MEIFIKVVQFVASLSLLILIHEFGHFLFARLFKIRVEKFYLFFDPWFSLFKFKRGDTEYGIGWLPLGGYCKISGMIDESMDREQMAQPPKPYEFRSKPAWQRLLVMIGGVLMNVVLACMIYIGMSYAWGDAYVSNDDLKWGYAYNELAEEIGFEDGDRIVAVDGEPVDDFSKIYPKIVIERATKVTVLRGADTLDIEIPEQYTARMLESADFMTPQVPFVVAQVMEGSAAEQAGIQTGDTLIAFNGGSMRFVERWRNALSESRGETVDVAVSRDSAGVAVVRNLKVTVSEDGMIGVGLAGLGTVIPVQTRVYDFWESIPAGLRRTGAELSGYWKQVKLIFNPRTEAYKSLGGFLAIGNIFPEHWSWERFWSLTAMLSIVLAVMNLLPIPGLDGGHVMFLLWEVVTRRKPSDKFLEYAQMVGMALLLLLLLYANGNDIYRFFIK